MGSLGARISSWRIFDRGHWVELVMPEKPGSRAPLETYPDENFSAKALSDKEAIFTVDHPDGFRVTKQITLLSEPPFHKVTVTFENTSKTPLLIDSQMGWGDGINKKEEGVSTDRDKPDAFLVEERAVGLANQVRSWRPGFLKGGIDTAQPGPFKWAGIDNNHFLAAFLPVDPKGAIDAIHVIFPKKGLPFVEVPLSFKLNPKESKTESYLLFVGPKKYDELKAAGRGLYESVDFGVFSPIARILLKGLKFFHSLTGNYGWAIVLLTILIQILVFPLTRRSLLHSVRMKDLQPQIKKLQDQFKSDPKRLQIETFNLYKKNGMKFMGMEGCFPMLLQIPVFIGFYATLRVAYELRGAPWIFWIHDLGAADPHYVLPILMGFGMFLQQKLTAVAADPAQARMMMFMPIIFTFMFLKLPAGLVLYWFVNSISTVVVQKYLAWRGHTAPLSAA